MHILAQSRYAAANTDHRNQTTAPSTLIERNSADTFRAMGFKLGCFSQLAIENTDELRAYSASQSLLDSKTKAQWRKSRAEEENNQADAWIYEALLINEGDIKGMGYFRGI
jgi:hypothetical protein